MNKTTLLKEWEIMPQNPQQTPSLVNQVIQISLQSLPYFADSGKISAH
jgi:hypothetical protein